MKIQANGISIEVEDTGGDGPVVMLVMGLGMQLTAWPPSLVQALVEAGYRVIRHDNRDAGLSQYFDELKVPSLAWTLLRHRLGRTPRSPYAVGDMALDAWGVLDALGVRRAHVVGASMGGMIAQRMAIAAPERTLTLTSIMSSSGARDRPAPRADVTRALLSRPRSKDLQVVLDYYVDFFRAIGGPGFPIPEAELRARLTISLQRAYHPQGVQRQMLAILADTTRPDKLQRITAPTLVIHGRDDPFVRLPCGEDTARRIPGARLWVIDGMGHDMPPGVVECMLPPMLEHFAGAQQRAAA